MEIKEANVTVMVADMKKAIRFYVEVLGLELKANYGDHYAQVASPGVTIGLHPLTKADSDAGESGKISIGFGVESLAAAIAELKAKGVAFSRVVEDRPTKLAFFTDLNGNPLYLSETPRWGRS
ncbi:MAG TPA: VOC family protein [Nitrososphaerales archaeon]|nr:VOC family protein [Nitrososphaerales archaeon]